MNKIQRSFTRAVQALTKVQSWPATIVGAGTRKGFSVIRFSNRLEMEVLNYRMSGISGLKVRVGYDPLMPGQLQVLGLRERFGIAGTITNLVYWIADHHKNHEFPHHDTVWVQGAQFLPLNVMPTSGFSVQVYGSVLRGDGEWVSITSETLDLSASQPAAGALYVLIEIDETGTCVTTDGAAADSRNELTMADIPEPTAGRMPVAAVLLFDSQTEILKDVRYGKRNDILDLRWAGYAMGGSATSIVTTAKNPPIDADKVVYRDSTASDALVTSTWTQVKAFLKTYFDTLYTAASHASATNNPHSVTAEQAEAIPENGWIAISEAWTRTGNHTFTVSGDVTADPHYQVGNKVLYQDGGGTDEFGVIASRSYSAPNTTIELIPNDDRAMASATITNRAVSLIENPEGFPASFNFAATTSVTSSSGSLTNITVDVAEFKVCGGELKFWFDVTCDLTTATALSLITSLPVTPLFASAFAAACRDASGGGVPLGTGASGPANGCVWRLASGSNWSIGATKRFYGSGSVLF